MKINLDHPTFTLKSKIQELCNPFFDDLGFNYFQYLRCYSNGSIGLLTNHTGLVEYFEHMDNEPVVFSSFNEDQAMQHSYWFLWDETLPEFPVNLARHQFNLRNGITLMRRSKNYYDMIAVALPYEQANPGSYYLNKIGAIEQFIKSFDKDHKDLLTIMDKNQIILPAHSRDVNYNKICYQTNKIPLAGKHHHTYITIKELDCLRLLLQGDSYKTIAQHLSISPRTVETYIKRIKERTGFLSTLELERNLFSKIG